MSCWRASRPIASPEASAASFVHAISHEPPQRPSPAVAQLNPADPKAIAIAANRDTDPAGLRRKLSGDLDAIVLTALDKEPARRYSTVATLRPISGGTWKAPR